LARAGSVAAMRECPLYQGECAAEWKPFQPEALSQYDTCSRFCEPLFFHLGGIFLGPFPGRTGLADTKKAVVMGLEADSDPTPAERFAHGQWRCSRRAQSDGSSFMAIHRPRWIQKPRSRHRSWRPWPLVVGSTGPHRSLPPGARGCRSPDHRATGSLRDEWRPHSL
jgi:hypothetical protein